MLKQINPRQYTLAELVAIEDVLCTVDTNNRNSSRVTFGRWLESAIRDIRSEGYLAMDCTIATLAAQQEAVEQLKTRAMLRGVPDVD